MKTAVAKGSAGLPPFGTSRGRRRVGARLQVGHATREARFVPSTRSSLPLERLLRPAGLPQAHDADERCAAPALSAAGWRQELAQGHGCGAAHTHTLALALTVTLTLALPLPLTPLTWAAEFSAVVLGQLVTHTLGRILELHPRALQVVADRVRRGPVLLPPRLVARAGNLPHVLRR